MLLSSLRDWYISKPPAWLEIRSSTPFIGFTAFIATFTDGFLYGSIVPVLPFSLVDRSGVPEDKVQMWLSVFLMTFGLTMTMGAPIAGWAANAVSSRKIPFLAGLGVAFVATVLFCFGHAPWVLVIARAFQGLSAPLINTTALALVADSVDRDQIGSWIGFVLSGMNFGLLISPFLAGAVYERAGYDAVFAVILGVIGLDFVLRVAMIEKRVATRWLESDKFPKAVVSNGESCPADSDPEHLSSSSTATEDEGPNEQTSGPDEHSPLLPSSKSDGHTEKDTWLSSKFPTAVALFSSPRLNAAVYGGFTHTMLIVAFDTILPLFVMKTFHWKATASGLVFLAITVPSLLSTFIGMLSDRYGARITSLLGFAVVTPALGLLGLCKDDSVTSQALLVVLLVLIGLGLNFMLTPLAADVFFEAEKLSQRNPSLFGVMGAFAQVYSLFNGALGLAAIVGPGLAGTLYDKSNWQSTVGVLAGLCGLGSLPVWRYTGSVKKGM